MTPDRNNILNKINVGLGKRNITYNVSYDKTIYKSLSGDLVNQFDSQFSALLGKFKFFENNIQCSIYLNQLCQDKKWTNFYCPDLELKKNYNEIKLGITENQSLKTCDFSITNCEYLIARTGSIVLSSQQSYGRTSSVYAPIHVCIAYKNQLIENEIEAFELLGYKYRDGFPSMISVATGPSRTADIEKTLIVGVHGPKEVYCFLINQ